MFVYTIIVRAFIASSVELLNIILYYKSIHLQFENCDIITCGYKPTRSIEKNLHTRKRYITPRDRR